MRQTGLMTVIPYRRPRRSGAKLFAWLLLAGGALFLIQRNDAPASDNAVVANRLVDDRDSMKIRNVIYGNCAQARAAGVAPIYRGQPGYAPWLDADDDGIACEPWMWRR
jgi:hypothetical protein